MGLEGPSTNGDKNAAGAGKAPARAAVKSTRREGRSSTLGCVWTFLVWMLGLVLLWYLASSESSDQGLLQNITTWAKFAILLILGLALGIHHGIKLSGHLDWRKMESPGSKLRRVHMGLSVLIAALAAALGLLLVIGGIDGLFRMKDAGSLGVHVMSIFLGVVGGCGGLLLAALAFPSKSVIAAEEERGNAWENLDFTPLEEHLGCTLPAAYKAMMQPGSEWREKSWMLHPRGLDNDDENYDVQGLHPPHPTALGKHPTTGETLLCFAWAEYGGYLLKPGSEDPPVFLVSSHSGPDNIEEIAPRLSEFLGWPREEE